MKFLENLINKPNKMQRTIGLTIQQLDLLTAKITPYWKTTEQQRKNSYSRKRSIGAGHPYKLATLQEKLVLVFLYYKQYLTQEVLGMMVDLDQANVSRLLKKMLPLIEKAADPEMANYLNKIKEEYAEAEKTNSLDKFYAENLELKEVSHDASEQQRLRPKNDDEQKKYYSGKKKKHTLKTQFSVAASGRVLDVSNTYPGSVHDKTIIDQEMTIDKIPKQTCQRLDSGYQGVKKKNPDKYIILPTKKLKGQPLSKLAKENNQAHSKRRVIVENVLSRLKKFRIFGGLYRGVIKSYNQVIRNIAAIINFKLTNTSIVM